MKVALPVLCVETRISYCRQLNNLCFLYFHHSLCLQLVYVPFGEFSSGTTNRIVSVSYIPAACFLQICLVWFLCQSLIHSDFFSWLSSFQLHTMHKSVAFILCQKWKQGKRKAEKDEYQGFKFFLTLSPPPQEMDMRDV